LGPRAICFLRLPLNNKGHLTKESISGGSDAVQGK
jgi:hypothetical protein